MNKNAMIICGHIRTFRQICDNIVKFKEKNNLDVYAYIWDENNPDDINFVVEKLQPVKWAAKKNEEVIQEFLNAEQRIRERNPKNLIHPDKPHTVISMYYIRRKTFEMIEQKYDNIVFTRFDTYVEPFDLEEVIKNSPNVVITPTSEQYGMVSDIFAIIPAIYADNYFFYERAEDLYSRRFEDDFKKWLLEEKFWWENKERDVRLHDENRYCPHLLYMRNFYETNTPYTAIDFPVYIKR